MGDVTIHIYIIMVDCILICENSFQKLRTMSKIIYGGGCYLMGPFGLIQFYLLFLGRDLAGMGVGITIKFSISFQVSYCNNMSFRN
jgi:hypothetical protein